MIIFFFNDTATTEIYTLSLHDALPISRSNALIVYNQSVHLDTATLLKYRITEAGDPKGHCL